MDIVAIQYLRGVAALMVVIYHLEPQLERMGYNGSWPLWLSSGVDVFFVISGFIMWVTTSGKSVSPLSFYRRRISRIVPIYWVLTTFVVALMLLSPKLLQTSIFDLEHVITSYLFFASEHPVKHTFEPVVIPGWTLNYEMFFYLIFGLSLFLPVFRRFQFVVMLFVALVLLGAWCVEPHSRAGFYLNSIILEFVLGVVVGFLFVRGVKLSWVTSLVLVVFGFGAIGFSTYWVGVLPRFIVWGGPAFCIVAGVVAFERAVGVSQYFLPRLLGDASYSIYLSHYMLISAVSQLWRKMNFPVDGYGLALFSIMAVLSALVAGVGVFYLVERPLGKGTRVLLKPSLNAAR